MQLIALIHFFERGHHIYVCNSETMSISMLMCARKNTEKKRNWHGRYQNSTSAPLFTFSFVWMCVCVCVRRGGYFLFRQSFVLFHHGISPWPLLCLLLLCRSGATSLNFDDGCNDQVDGLNLHNEPSRFWRFPRLESKGAPSRPMAVAVSSPRCFLIDGSPLLLLLPLLLHLLSLFLLSLNSSRARGTKWPWTRMYVKMIQVHPTTLRKGETR